MPSTWRWSRSIAMRSIPTSVSFLNARFAWRIVRPRGHMKVRINYAICNSCGLCREVCPEWAITQKYLEPRHLYEVHAEKCTGCGDCPEYCPAPGDLVLDEL